MPPSPPSQSPDLLPGAHIVINGEAIAARLKNISTRGASALTGRPIAATTSAVLALSLSSGAQFYLPGTTVYSVESGPGIFETGIRLQPLTEESLRFVTELMLLLAHAGKG